MWKRQSMAQQRPLVCQQQQQHLGHSRRGESWSVFGDGGATHGMEVLGTTLFAIQSNDIRAFDVVTGEQLGSCPLEVSILF